MGKLHLIASTVQIENFTSRNRSDKIEGDNRTELALSIDDRIQFLKTTYPVSNGAVIPSDSVATVTWASGDSN